MIKAATREQSSASRELDAAYAQEIVDHVTAKINAAPLQLEPYPHLIVSNLMPDDFYDMALEFCATRTAYAVTNTDGNKEAIFSPGGSQKNSPLLSEEAKEFWNFFRETVCTTVNRTANAKMRQQIDQYIEWLRRTGIVDNKAEAPRVSDSELQVFQRSVSEIGAHHHALFEVVTSLIYMPADDHMADTGTWLHRLTGKIYVKWGWYLALSWRPPFVFIAKATRLMTYNMMPKFLEAREKQARYMPNTLLTILNTPWSIHSQGTPHRDKRHLLLFSSVIDGNRLAKIYGGA